MNRRSFLRSVAALAVAPVASSLPALPAALPVVAAVPVVTGGLFMPSLWSEKLGQQFYDSLAISAVLMDSCSGVTDIHIGESR